jgi:hypothetical protein
VIKIVQMIVFLDEKENEKLKKFASKNRLSKAEAIREIIRLNIKDD